MCKRGLLYKGKYSNSEKSIVVEVSACERVKLMTAAGKKMISFE